MEFLSGRVQMDFFENTYSATYQFILESAGFDHL